MSVLEFLQGMSATVAKDYGIFLAKTYRLRPSICNFISEVFYNSQLQAETITTTRSLDLQGVAGLPDEGMLLSLCSTRAVVRKVKLRAR